MNLYHSIHICNRKDYKNIPKLNNIYGANYYGLCNQLLLLSHGIRHCITNNKKFLVIDCFTIDALRGSICKLSEIIDFNKTFLNIQKTFNKNIYLLDRSSEILNIISAHYGINNTNYRNVTPILNEYLLNKTKLYFNNNYNASFGDPYDGKQKYLYLKIEIDNQIIDLVYDENNIIDIDLIYNKTNLFANNNIHIAYTNDINNKIDCQEIIPCLEFNDNIIKLINNIDFVKKLSDDSKLLTTIHYRMDSDWMYFATDSGKYAVEYKQKLDILYGTSINNIINENVFVMSYEHSNFDTIFTNAKNIYHIAQQTKMDLIHKYLGEKYKGREICALIDFLIAFNYTDTFIGLFDTETCNGSSFSMMLSFNDKMNHIYLANGNMELIKYK